MAKSKSEADPAVHQGSGLTLPSEEEGTLFEVKLGEPPWIFVDYPGARQIGALSSPSAVRLEEMTIHEHSLMEAEAALHLMARTTSQMSASLRQVLWTGAVVAYCRCFKGITDRLMAQVVFETLDGAAMATHDDLWALRDKHFAHDVNPLRQAYVGALTDEKGELLAIVEQQVVSVMNDVFLANSRNLVAAALGYVRTERLRLNAELKTEVGSWTNQQRLDLPIPKVTTPGWSMLTTKRRSGPRQA